MREDLRSASHGYSWVGNINGQLGAHEDAEMLSMARDADEHLRGLRELVHQHGLPAVPDRVRIVCDILRALPSERTTVEYEEHPSGSSAPPRVPASSERY